MPGASLLRFCVSDDDVFEDDEVSAHPEDERAGRHGTPDANL
jgi:hypothetical protein